jgi:hypothetical protein
MTTLKKLCVGFCVMLAIWAVPVGGSVAASNINICCRSPGYYLLNPNRIPSAPVVIAGVNFNNATNNPVEIRLALRGPGLYGGSSPSKLLNREFVAAQLSLASAGGSGSPVPFSALNSQLNSYGVSFASVTLSNGATLSTDSTLGDLFEETLDAIRDNRPLDFGPLAQIWAQLNGTSLTGSCS